MISYVFAGSDNTAAFVLEALCDQQPPELVITREDAPFGRKKELKQTQVAEVAEKFKIGLIKANDPQQALDQIKASGANRGIVVSYGAILKGEVLNSLDWFNLHFSLLPKLRGAAPVQRAILENQRPTGISVFKIDAGMDTGDVYTQLEVDIDGMNTQQALEAMSQQSIPLLKMLLNDSNPELTEQTGEPSIAPKLSRDECELNPQLSSRKLLQIVLAANPEPIAWINHKGQPLRVISAKTTGISTAEDKPIGQVERISGKIYLACGGGTSLELVTVQPFSKKPMPAIDWFNGVGEVILGN